MGIALYLAFLVATPVMAWRWSRRQSPRAAAILLRTTLATWAGAAIAFHLSVDLDSPGTWFRFGFFVLPCTIIPVAAVVVTLALRHGAALLPAAGGATAGWLLSMLPLLIGHALGIAALDSDRLFAGCIIVAPSSIYAASLAVLLGVAARPRT
jgi:hypothetical protein